MRVPKKSSWLILLLSHHLDPKENTFCINEKVYICSRCSGLYPATLLFSIIFYYNNHLLKYKVGDYFIGYLSITTGTILWLLEKIEYIRFDNKKRLITGLITGIGIGWIVALNIIAPFSERVIELICWSIIVTSYSILVVLIKISL